MGRKEGEEEGLERDLREICNLSCLSRSSTDREQVQSTVSQGRTSVCLFFCLGSNAIHSNSESAVEGKEWAVCSPSQTFPTLDLTCTNCGALGALDLSPAVQWRIFVLVGGETNLGGKVQGGGGLDAKTLHFMTFKRPLEHRWLEKEKSAVEGAF